MAKYIILNGIYLWYHHHLYICYIFTNRVGSGLSRRLLIPEPEERREYPNNHFFIGFDSCILSTIVP